MEYIQWHIPISAEKRPGTKINPTSLTIHNTANPLSSAKNERNWLVNDYNNATASWHIVVDQREAVEAIPLNEVAWHAGDGSGKNSGNMTSIGIEICESGDQDKVWNNAVQLIVDLLYERGWGVDRVRTHQSWSGKNCPRLLLPRWSEFIAAIQQELQERGKEQIAIETEADADMEELTPDWKKEGIDYLTAEGLLHDPEQWLAKINEPIPVWTVMLLLKRIDERRNLV